MKDYVREMLTRLTDEERDEFLLGMPKDMVWRMAEGNPHSTEDTTIEVVAPTPILGGILRNKNALEGTQSPTDVVYEVLEDKDNV